MNAIQLRQKIIDYKRIPSIPNQVHQLLQAFTKDDLSYRELAKIIENHPTIAARLIALANSAWAAPLNPVNSVEKACLNLGFMVVRSVSIGLALISPFNISFCPDFDIRRYWVSSKLVADGAVLLASGMPTQPPHSFLQIVHSGGLLHNLGLLCLADLMPKEMQQALLTVKEAPELTLNETLHQMTDTDFCEVGGLFAETWGLPEDLVAIMKYHRDNHYQGQYREYTLLVGNAALMVSALFRNQETLSPQITLEKLEVSQAYQQQIFDKLQTQFQETSELARVLFHAN